MMRMTDAEVLAEALRHTTGNGHEIEVSKDAGCVSCCAVFDVKIIQDWRDEWETPEKQGRARRWTAQCPRCGEPTVIGSSAGLLNDQAYLPVVNDILARQSAVKRQAFRKGRSG